MLDQLRRVLFRWKLDPKRAIADTTCGTVENIVALEDLGIRADVPLPDFDQRTPYYGASKFTYDPDIDSYRCPHSETLIRKNAKYTVGVIVYQATAAACNACPLKEQCTASESGRMLHRSLYEEYLQRVRGHHETPTFEKAMTKRQVWVDPLFAEGKQWHYPDKSRLRGRKKVNIEELLIASVQDLKRWIQATDWGKRHMPGSNCGRVSATLNTDRAHPRPRGRRYTPRSIRIPGLEACRENVNAPLSTGWQVPGHIGWQPRDLATSLARLAEPLPQIHAIPVPDDCLIPPYDPYALEMRRPPRWASDPDMWWRAIAVFEGPPPVEERCLIHRDYHPGNVLWSRGKVTGIVDWGHASIGSPYADVAHCRVNLAYQFGQDAADRFLALYEELTGWRNYHPYWDIVAAIGGMDKSLDDDSNPSDERFLARAVAQL